MHIFVSWSGERAGLVARALDVFLRDVLNDVTTFISQNLGGGVRWADEIDKELDRADYGIVCITKDRFRAPWINYEAGALGRALPGESRTRVVPLLLDHDNASDLPAPLSIFNVSLSSETAIYDRIIELNELGGSKVRADTLKRRFDMAWPELQKALKIAAIVPDPEVEDGEPAKGQPDLATFEEKIDEILSYMRRAARNESPHTSTQGGTPTNDLLRVYNTIVSLVGHTLSKHGNAINTNLVMRPDSRQVTGLVSAAEHDVFEEARLDLIQILNKIAEQFSGVEWTTSEAINQDFDGVIEFSIKVN